MDDWARLESVCTLTGTVGSNPTPSAIVRVSEALLSMQAWKRLAAVVGQKVLSP